MYQIVKKKILSEQVILMEVLAPAVARKAKPGQFIMLRVDENGERIPLTIADHNEKNGLVTIIFQTVGNSTYKLGELNEGEYIHDFVGPLGTASELEGLKKVAVIGGGLGCAIAYPQAKELYKSGAHVDLIAGFRNKDIIILEDEMRACSTNLYITTDDGSNGCKGFVTDVLKKILDDGNKYDAVIAIGPMIMMKSVCAVTKPFGIKTIVSMNSIMVDGTGMCGGCRITVGGETKFACVDGPDFDGHLVDFDEAMRRATIYKEFEQQAKQKHECRFYSVEVQ